MEPSRFFTHSLRDSRLARILAAALEAVEPGKAVRRHFRPEWSAGARRVCALAMGKAAAPMVEALAGLTTLSAALVIAKHTPRRSADTCAEQASSLSHLRHAQIMEGGHPIPDERSLDAGRAALDFVSDLHEDDLLICLISGGASALVTAPREGVSLADLQALTAALLACGAPIEEVNTLRRRLDEVKGGGLARATRAQVISLILSDVIGDRLEAIASGPTAPDPTTRERALAILHKYHLEQRAPASILFSLRSGPETPKPGDPLFERVENIIIADNTRATQAARRQAETEGFAAEILSTAMRGEAREVGRQMVETLTLATRKRRRPFCLIAGGETTVTIQGNGRGGRNQELALAAVPALAGLENVMLIALATDGEDGPTEAAGAVATGETLGRARSLGLDAADHLSRNDAYTFFAALDDCLRSGPTGTNVNDLVFLLAL